MECLIRTGIFYNYINTYFTLIFFNLSYKYMYFTNSAIFPEVNNMFLRILMKSICVKCGCILYDKSGCCFEYICYATSSLVSQKCKLSMQNKYTYNKTHTRYPKFNFHHFYSNIFCSMVNSYF